ncbi:hypothetical protein JCM3770_000766, partial [Rhodotorula araucariae]
IAIRDYAFPSSRTTALTPALHDRVSSYLAGRWGAHAGWAQQVLFFADLKSSPTKTVKSAATAVYAKLEVELLDEAGARAGPVAEAERKLTFEEEVAALIAAPGTKRRRRTVLQANAAGVVMEEEDVELEESLSAEEGPAPSKKGRRPAPMRRQSSGRRVKKE